MLVPIDDHLVHRGDGVFEAIKFINKKFYLLDEHLLRLKSSAEKISLKATETSAELKEIILNLVKVSGLESGMISTFYLEGLEVLPRTPMNPKGLRFILLSQNLNPWMKKNILKVFDWTQSNSSQVFLDGSS